MIGKLIDRVIARSGAACALAVYASNRPMCSSALPAKAGRSVPRRAVLYVPGDSVKKIEKARNLDADCIVLDCEDGVAATTKNRARETICQTLATKTDFRGSEVAVRINSISSGLADDDMRALFESSAPPTTIVIPKVDSIDHMRWLAETLQRYPSSVGLQLITMVESAESLLNVREICHEAASTMKRVRGDHVAIIFGSDDFCASIGATRTARGTELLYARQKVVTVAKYFQLQAIDMVHIDYKDLEGLREYSLESATMGFTGKQVIHPSQIDIVQSCYSPSSEKVTWAEQLVEAFEKHRQEGKGAFVFRDQMIDKPSLLQAENIKRMADIIRHKEKRPAT